MALSPPAAGELAIPDDPEPRVTPYFVFVVDILKSCLVSSFGVKPACRAKDKSASSFGCKPACHAKDLG